jgi:Protein of unknown function (DUF1501)
MKDKFGFDSNTATAGCFWKRPTMGRRMFFKSMGAAVSGYYLLPGHTAQTIAKAGGTTQNTAKKVIFVLMAGAPSHTDTFDLKVGAWTPASFKPTSYGNGAILWPQGLMPTLAANLDSIALVRSAQAWAEVHGLCQTWVQIGRNPSQGTSKIAPHIGSVVAMEMASTDPSKTLPPFVSLNAGGNTVGCGFLPAQNNPFYINPNGGGLPNATHPDGQTRFNSRYALHQSLDQEIMTQSPYGSVTDEMVAFDADAKVMMYNSQVNAVFTSTSADRVRYGNTSFGNACLAARNLVSADLGTHFVQITVGGWDNHQNIYASNVLPTLGAQFDLGLGNLIADLKANGTLDSTLIVAMGEFGRTVGPLNQGSGRDHYLQQTVFFAGAKVSGGTTVGTTDALGANTVDPGWSRQRNVKPEDIEATIYSALGIDWTKVAPDPTGRGFDYVPFASEEDLYGPVNELWG